ncbi:hypothetical protein GCM10010222_67810 [Streptomyces tanashiensis]|uniref:peptidoglycan-binding domain-containing protein n=1 Tax=Streptomyces tanashiensis TaxID=67367 RepID=UPI00167260EF|nr:peptidoglycan-binding domain-containing protein [Streptomyces tanashiensis]GGT16282.1 hypothetical protein GCM10010222_67810 [Streptomyces tanashiensis]
MPHMVRKGDSGPTVSRLQTDLDIHGYPVGQVDGIFGKKTDAAVRKFQSEHDLVVTGSSGRLHGVRWRSLFLLRR